MDEQQFINEKKLSPTFDAGEIYSMLCVPDITRSELIKLIDLLTKEGARYDKDQFHWLTCKVQEVADRIAPNVPEDIKKLYARSKKALPPADENYIDYTSL